MWVVNYTVRDCNGKLIVSVLPMMKRYLFLLLGGLSSCGVLLRGLPEDQSLVMPDASDDASTLDGALSADGTFTPFDVTDVAMIDVSAPLVDVACPSHSNGLGQLYESCDPIGTWTESTARAACRAYIGSRATMSCVTNPPDNCRGFDHTMVGSVKYSSDPLPMAIWDFAGSGKGHAVVLVDGGSQVCPTLTDPSWN